MGNIHELVDRIPEELVPYFYIWIKDEIEFQTSGIETKNRMLKEDFIPSIEPFPVTLGEGYIRSVFQIEEGD